MKILTFDVEDWFHILDHPALAHEKAWSAMPSRVEEGIDRILSMLSEAEQRATFFCLGWVGEKYPAVIKRIDEAGHEIGTHSHRHSLVYDQTPEAFEADLCQSLEVLQGITGKKITCYRAPGFSITSKALWAFEKLVENGIDYDCSLFPAARAHGGISHLKIDMPMTLKVSGAQLKCFPLNTTRLGLNAVVYSGGGYFRLLPKAYLSYLFAKHPYVMTYFHPRDFDPEQPIIPGLSPLRRFKSYVGLSGAETKLRAILQQYDFMTVLDAASAIDWASVPEVGISELRL